MFRWDYNLFIGDESEDVHVGFSAGEHAFLIAESSSEATENPLGALLEDIKNRLEKELPSGLDGCVGIIQDGLVTIGPLLRSFACVYMSDDVSYLVTRGMGEIYISRHGATQRLLQGSQTASGVVEDKDYFILANATFIQKSDMAMVKNLVSTQDPQELVESITPDLKGTDNMGMIALFMQATAGGVQETVEDDDTIVLDEEDRPFMGVRDNRPDMSERMSAQDVPVPVPQPPAQPISPAPQPTAPTPSLQPAEPVQSTPPSGFKRILMKMQASSSRGKKITALLVVLLLCVLSWSIVSGNSRRKKAQFVEKVHQEQTKIAQSLDEAEKLSGVNNQKALSLIDASRESVTLLKQEAQTLKLESLPELADLAGAITKTEQSIRKSEKGSVEEYYDMALIDGNTRVTKTYVSGTEVALLDTKNGSIHVLDMESKSVDTYSSSHVKSAKFVALHNGTPYIFTQKNGIYAFESAKKDKQILPYDPDWGAIVEFLMYNGNIYLVDSTQNMVYKYLVAEGGYSEKKAYFGEGQTIDLGSATAGAVDSALYIATGEKIQKYVSGVRESYAVSIPDGDAVTFEDIYTAKDLDPIYAMDTDSGVIYILSKKGEFQKQLSVSVAKDADDVFATADGIFILSHNKLYKVKE